MKQINNQFVVGTAAKIGSLLFLLWGVLHVWVGFEGIHQYLTNGTQGLWNVVIGGVNAPRAVFQHAADAVTAHARGNYC